MAPVSKKYVSKLLSNKKKALKAARLLAQTQHQLRVREQVVHVSQNAFDYYSALMSFVLLHEEVDVLKTLCRQRLSLEELKNWATDAESLAASHGDAGAIFLRRLAGEKEKEAKSTQQPAVQQVSSALQQMTVGQAPEVLPANMAIPLPSALQHSSANLPSSSLAPLPTQQAKEDQEEDQEAQLASQAPVPAVQPVPPIPALPQPCAEASSRASSAPLPLKAAFKPLQAIRPPIRAASAVPLKRSYPEEASTDEEEDEEDHQREDEEMEDAEMDDEDEDEEPEPRFVAPLPFSLPRATSTTGTSFKPLFWKCERCGKHVGAMLKAQDEHRLECADAG